MAPLTTLARRLLALARSNRGVSAVEFALILPVMLLLYAGGVELSEALSVDRKVNRVSSTICDLVSQVSNVSSSDMTDIFNASAAILEPYSTGTSLKMQILVVDIGSTKQTVNWSKAKNDSVYAKGVTSPITVPSAIAVVGTQVVIARVRYSYQSPFGDLMKSVTGHDTYDLEHVFMMRPRLGTSITFSS
ncbi:TadE/TadG family type IV pilus assembly protein [Oharaeibacter diazotrophicus]|uniref:Flp pilus assembly protein TadG n=1 Tax=Oharaeibacter diazotrophicus TaxID=1920512 RepID=A0A4R6RDC8_9HYPH|nr:TadE/TadG family type IV pilus assembly protein [Oharaeibacter diazotrophicus]TDP84142.1 Flp pilus assembly protein TadG [Oharaeibacter diazotrophicus]BBE73181.1 TadE-like protein [Pleomorphomonas sp. SM30]GLS74970.1 pilus biosynthesis protein TadE [Oharaeibacter diazotrophicus]